MGYFSILRPGSPFFNNKERVVVSEERKMYFMPHSRSETMDVAPTVPNEKCTLRFELGYAFAFKRTRNANRGLD